MTRKEILSINLKYYSFLLNMTQEEFAHLTYTDLRYYIKMENFHKKFSNVMLDKLAF